MSREQVSECLKDEAANALVTVLKSTNSITLLPGVTLQRRPEEEITELTNSIASTGRTQMSSFDRFWDNWQKFLSSWSVNIQLTGNQDVEEGRGKKKKIFRYIAVAAATAAAILIPIKLKILALMAASALVIGKIALVLTSLVGLKTLVSKPHEETTHVHYDAHRSDQGHYLAYSGYDLPPGNSVDYYQ
uniref:Uncharacterized protein n=2 Tax=Rhodnius prolixus TaxID=13249 RepID=T1I0K3_RHOPR